VAVGLGILAGRHGGMRLHRQLNRYSALEMGSPWTMVRVLRVTDSVYLQSVGLRPKCLIRPCMMRVRLEVPPISRH